jgi:hypothetical protein
MKRLATLITGMLLFFLLFVPRVQAGGETQPVVEGEKNFYAAVVVPAMMIVKKALPPAPAGWVTTAETRIETAPPGRGGDAVRSLRFSYVITYRRVEGLAEEEKRLDDVYRESSMRHEEEAKPQIEELLKKQTETSLKLRKAARRRNQAEVRRLNDELDENGKTMRALHEETDGKIALDVDRYLIKDAEASIRVSLNDSRAELLPGEPVSVRGAAFALRREGGPAGATIWKEGQTLVLYGDWQLERENTFRIKGEQPLFSAKAKTVCILITAEKKRAEQLFKKMDVKAILSLMK